MEAAPHCPGGVIRSASVRGSRQRTGWQRQPFCTAGMGPYFLKRTITLLPFSSRETSSLSFKAFTKAERELCP